MPHNIKDGKAGALSQPSTVQCCLDLCPFLCALTASFRDCEVFAYLKARALRELYAICQLGIRTYKYETKSSCSYAGPNSIYLTVSLPSDKLCRIPEIPENPENEGLSSLFFFLASYPKMLPNAEMKIAKKILDITKVRFFELDLS